MELGLDVELAANESRGPARLASAQLRSFVDEIRTFLASDERGSVGSLLAWLDHAEETDELMPRPEPPEPGVVQLLTIHGAKGLEWDAVAVVRLVQEELPKRPRTTLGWLGFGVLPYDFRGDRDALPALDWDPGAPGDRPTLTKAIAAFKAANRAHQEKEERRLAYVAVTRARHDLMLTGSQWGGQRDAAKAERPTSMRSSRRSGSLRWSWTIRERTRTRADWAPLSSGRWTRWAPAVLGCARPPRW